MLDLLKFSLGYWKYPNLDKVAIIGVQHLMESILEMFRSLRYCGLRPENTFLLGKCYSSSKSVYKDFTKEGFKVLKDSLIFDSHQEFDQVHKKNIKKLLKLALNHINLNELDKLIILDDGGELISIFNEIEIDKSKIIGIEQTSSGFHKIKDLILEFPVINVAKSDAKLVYETPFIIESSVKRLNYHISIDEIQEANFLILGYGSIGEYLEQYLTATVGKNAKISSFDPVRKTKKDLPHLLKSADIILGTSGEISLPYNFYKYLERKRVILASLSSSDREFEAWKFRKNSPKNMSIWQNYENSNIVLLQSGFPINFWGSRNNMDLNYIQITLSLLLGAIFQGIRDHRLTHHLHQVDPHFQSMISNRFRKVLLEMKLSQVHKERLKKLSVG